MWLTFAWVLSFLCFCMTTSCMCRMVDTQWHIFYFKKKNGWDHKNQTILRSRIEKCLGMSLNRVWYDLREEVVQLFEPLNGHVSFSYLVHVQGHVTLVNEVLLWHVCDSSAGQGHGRWWGFTLYTLVHPRNRAVRDKSLTTRCSCSSQGLVSSFFWGIDWFDYWAFGLEYQVIW